MAAGSVWDEIFDTEHVEVVRTYIEQWPRKGRQPEKVLIVVVQPDAEHRWLCPHCGVKQRAGGVGYPQVADPGHAREAVLPGGGAAPGRVRGAREGHRGGAVGPS